MKKLVFTLVLCFAVGLAFGQKKALKVAKDEIKSLKPNIEDAKTAIQSALKDPETMNNAETWYVAGMVENKLFDIERAKEILGQAPNEDVMYPALVKIYPYFVKADELDQLPDAKGKIKPKFRKDIKAIMLANRPYYINAGSYFYEKGDYKQAYENFRFYGDLPKLPIFEGDSKSFNIQPNDTNDVKIRFYAALAANEIPNVDASIELFSEIKDSGWNENEIYQRLASEYNQKEDTVHYEEVLKQGVNKFPKEPYYILNLINLDINQGKIDEAINYLQKAIEVSPNDAQLYDVLGLVYENTRQPEKAIENIKKALEINSDYADALSHLGRIYYNSGIEARAAADNITDTKLYNEARKKVDNFFNEAIPYFEKAYQLNPQDNDAVFALRNIYYSLGNNAAYEKWDKIYMGEQ
ncbi:MAG: tetratricopeptide repeat protein [Dysgonamonadaceae bacterium]|jgi:tetratricopeptide (TPR) repeat protein|nr:tetratricopeptide repeat protein [Dysgonamonadaceae bacterium]